MAANGDENEIRNRKTVKEDSPEEEFEQIENVEEKETENVGFKSVENADDEKKKTGQDKTNTFLTVVNTGKEIILRLVLFFIVYLVLNRLHKIIFK